jgi:acetyl esterase/lipase
MLYQKEILLSRTPYLKHATIYYETEARQNACILYFHGGGLLCGSRNDLPELHLRTLTKAGLTVIAFDYPLTPAAKLPLILEDVTASINDYIENQNTCTDAELPFFLWGRSAGAYLCLIAAAGNRLLKAPNGIISYYGYGFLCDSWFDSPNLHYCTLPPVNESCLKTLPSSLHADGSLDTHYSSYVYARQTGLWKSLFYEGREKFFFLEYSLRTCDKLPCPLFCTHSTGDPDVPYSEFLKLCEKYLPRRFVVSGDMHDFDRMEESPVTLQLLEKTLCFVEEHL